MLLPVQLFAQVDLTSSNLPILVIETGDQEIVDEHRIVADMGIINKGEGLPNLISDPFNDYSGKISIEIRGSSSQDFPKKSYGFETQDKLGENRNVSLVNLPVENDWVLYAPYSDKSLIRNILSYKLSRELGQYAPRTKLCEVILNEKYLGVYVLTEKIKRDQNRVNIATLNPDEILGEDLSGGYIIKIDKKTGDSGPLWTSELGGIYFQYEYPDHDAIVPEQKDYIKNYIDDFENVLVSDFFADPDFGFRKYMDANSAVDYFIANEVSKNVDGYALSTFLYKKKDSDGGKLHMGPIWDFNLAFGNAYYRGGFMTSGFQMNINSVPWWWGRFMEDPTFIEEIKNKWYNIRENRYKDDVILAMIDSLSFILDEAQERNFEQWDIIDHKIWPNFYVGETYDDQLEYLKTWTINRLHWLDKSFYSWTGLENNSTDHKTSVYPNPFVESFNYHFTIIKPGEVSLILYDLNGSSVSNILDRVYHSPGEYSLETFSPELPSSIYLLVLKVNEEIVSRKKVVKL